MHHDMYQVISDAVLNQPLQFARFRLQRHADGRLIGNDFNALQWQNLCAVVQPVKNNQSKFLTEGDQTLDAITIWCCQRLNPTWGNELQLGDVLRYQERIYRIHNVQNWSHYGYWKATATEVRQYD